MRTLLIFVAAAVAAVSADPTAEAYTIGQVAAGLPFANAVATGHAHNPGYIAYTSYPASSYLYAGHYLGKREAEPYTLGQVAAGLPYANAVATGHAHNPGYIAYVSYPSNAYVNAYAAAPLHYIGKRDAEPYTLGQVAAGLPYANALADGRAHNPGYIAYVEYPGHAYANAYAAAPLHYIGKREAEPYTLGQVAAGLPYANAVATGHAHNPGYIAYAEYPSGVRAPVVAAAYGLPFYG